MILNNLKSIKVSETESHSVVSWMSRTFWSRNSWNNPDSCVCRIQRTCTASVCVLSGAVRTAISTCRSLLWSGCITKLPADLLGSSRSKTVRNRPCFTYRLTVVWTTRLTTKFVFVSESEGGRASSSSASSLTRVYHCDVCDEDLKLTSTEILKHKRQHMYSAK